MPLPAGGRCQGARIREGGREGTCAGAAEHEDDGDLAAVEHRRGGGRRAHIGSGLYGVRVRRVLVVQMEGVRELIENSRHGTRDACVG